jgi:hypothetical protein
MTETFWKVFMPWALVAIALVIGLAWANGWK